MLELPIILFVAIATVGLLMVVMVLLSNALQTNEHVKFTAPVYVMIFIAVGVMYMGFLGFITATLYGIILGFALAVVYVAYVANTND